MSNFITRLPVNIDAVVKQLPKGSTVLGLDFVGNAIEVRWCNDGVHTGLTFHQDWPLDFLKRRKLPKGAKERERAASETVATVEGEPVEAGAPTRKPSRD